MSVKSLEAFCYRKQFSLKAHRLDQLCRSKAGHSSQTRLAKDFKKLKGEVEDEASLKNIEMIYRQSFYRAIFKPVEHSLESNRTRIIRKWRQNPGKTFIALILLGMLRSIEYLFD